MNMLTPTTKDVKDLQQAGFVSIVVCMIIMTILSLITIGFAQLMAREQRQALDRQLSSQAFYAAESGVNDALLNVGALSASSCTGSAKDIAAASVGGVRISCVTGNSVVTDIRSSDVPADPGSPRIYPLRTGAKLTTVQIRWSPSNSVGTPFLSAGTQPFPAISAWNRDTGVLKVHLMPFGLTGAGSTGRNNLINDMGHVVLMPVAAGGPGVPSVTYANISGNNKGAVVNAACTAAPAPGQCAVDITGIPVTYLDMFISVASLYRPSDIVIDGTNAAGTSESFRDAQVVIDATGRTTDVVRRIQVRRPIQPQVRTSTGALVTDGAVGICKLLRARPGSGGTTDIETACP